MRKRRLLWQLYPSYLAIMLISLLAVAWYSSRSLKQFYLRELAVDLRARAELVERQISHLMGRENREALNGLCAELGRQISTRITVVLPSGEVIADSDRDPELMDNHGDRPEIMGALESGYGTSTRYSNTVERDMMYVAIPVSPDGETAGVIRTSIPLTSIEEALSEIYLRIALGGIIIALLAAGIGLAASRRISRPLEEMRKGAIKFAEGEFGSRLAIPDSAEMGELAEAMNLMAERLDERIRVVTRQRNEREAILASMTEAVLAVDNDERIIRFNSAAGRLLDVDTEEAQGRSMQEVIRNVELQQFVQKALASAAEVEGSIVLEQNGRRTLQAHGTGLYDAAGESIGALVVLNDITRLKRLENIRRDFVANVSHELKTPATAILGYIETLREGAIDDPETARPFLDTIKKHSDRLNSIIEDLLSLSRIEQGVEKDGVRLAAGSIVDVLRAAIAGCESKSTDKAMKIELDCPPELTAAINAELLEQAMINLIDNAIKYSEEGQTVRVEAAAAGDEVIVSVTDKGCGISAEHRPRIFERFYRVDRGRSREEGGTGLGLAIVKHIAQAHGGRVEVESRIGEGSRFSIHLKKLGEATG